jgi:hypothetical protein
MDALALVAGVGKQGIEPVAREGLIENRPELGVVTPWAAVYHGTEDEMALRIADGGKLWPAVP